MKIAVLLSGGVDSSLALALLREAGHEVTAFYLKIWLEDELAFLGECPWQEDLDYARSVCQQLKVPLQIMSLQREYYHHVVSYCLDELRAGRTPSPDIFCNQRIKFGVFLESVANDFAKIASGHYARIELQQEKTVLKTCPDAVKDQTYFLAHLHRSQLERLLFPIGHLNKAEVRSLAREYDLPTKNRKDSQGICFLGKIKYRDFVKFHLGEQPGDIREVTSGEKLGSHNGYWYYTIGQRQGLGLSGGPWYVTQKDIANNIIYVSRHYDKEYYARDCFWVDAGNWINNPPPTTRLRTKIRHGPKFYECSLENTATARQVRLTEKDPGIAPGQYAIFYDGDICLGCARIID